MPSGLIAVIILSLIHLLSLNGKLNRWFIKKPVLALGSGISLSYVFIDLLPALNRGQSIFIKHFSHIAPYLKQHSYIIALLGILFYGFSYAQNKKSSSSWVKSSGYLFFNFVIGAALSNTSNPELQPLSLFTLAIGLHYFIRDHLGQIWKNPHLVMALIIMLYLGYATASYLAIPEVFLALCVCFASGGIILHVIGYELRDIGAGYYRYFVLGALVYTIILLSLGEGNATNM